MTGEPRSGDPVLIDGDLEPELARRGVAARPTPGAAPPPIREPEAVRRLLVEIARAGADVLTAPAAHTHRRALTRLGEARRAREWTFAAVALTREAATAAADEAEEEASRTRADQRPVRTALAHVAGLLAPLENRDVPELAPDEATALAEHRTQAGLLVDAGVDLLRVGGMGTLREAHAATVAATGLDLEVWSGVVVDGSGTQLRSGEPLDAWLEAILPLDPAALVVEGPTARSIEIALGRLRASTPTPTGAGLEADLQPDAYAAAVDGWLADGAAIVACGRDGEPARVAACRAVLDRRAAERQETAAAARVAWAAWLEEGARRAGTGDAAVVVHPGPEHSSSRLPVDVLPSDGALRWRAVPGTDIPRLPGGHFQLCVALADRFGRDDLLRLVAALAPGGWLLLGGADTEPSWVRWLAADGRIELLQPTGTSPGGSISGWLGRRRP